MKAENIIKHSTGIAIFNGGNPLEGCPQDWDEARRIEQKFNEGKGEEYGLPQWSFDCGFKLDYDGPIIRVSSRFYPPKTHYGSTWDGTVLIMCGDKDLIEQKFDCPTLEELRKQVEEYVLSIQAKIIEFLTPNTPITK